MDRIPSGGGRLDALDGTNRPRRPRPALWLIVWTACALGAGVVGAADDGVSATGLAAETTLLQGTGPFEVSGTTHSYAVAWVDGDERRGHNLTLTWFEAGRIVSARQIDVGVDPEARIFLQVQPRQAVVAWRGGGGWRLGVFARIDEGGAAPQVLELGTEVEVEALSARPDRAALFLVPQADPGQALARVAAAAPEVEFRGSESIDLPALSAPTLLVVRFAAPEAPVLLPVPGAVFATALSREEERWGVTAIDETTGRVVHLQIDPLAVPRGSDALSTFPATGPRPVVSESPAGTVAGWIEDRPEGPTAVIGMLSPDGALSATEQLSSHGAEPRNVAISGTRGLWATWAEVAEGGGFLRSSALRDGRVLCGESVETAALPDRLWVLGEGEQATVLAQSAPHDGERSLSVRHVVCEALGDGEPGGRPRDGGTLPGASSGSGEGAMVNLGAAEDPCDGLDNDNNGTIDDGCDTTCNAPQVIGTIRMTAEGAPSESPSLVAAGGGFGVAFQDGRDGNLEIYFHPRTSATNSLATDIRVTTDASTSEHPSLAWSGTQYGVAWEDWRDGDAEIYFARLDAAGSKIGGDVRVTNVGGSSLGPSLVWTGSEYGVTWMDSRDSDWEIYFTRLDASGNKLGSDVRVTNFPGTSQTPSLVWAGGEYGLVWTDDKDGNPEIYFAIITVTGALSSSYRVTNDPAFSGAPGVVWAGTEFGVAWEDSRGGEDGIYFARLRFSAKVGGDVQVISQPDGAYNPSLEWTGSEYGISWDDFRHGSSEIYLARLGAMGAELGELRITVDPATSSQSSLAWNGAGYGVVWWDDRAGNREIHIARVDCCDDADSDGFSDCAGDSNDGDPAIHPGAVEACDGRDNDSDEAIDEVCDSSCDSPQKRGVDTRITTQTGRAHLPSLVWAGDGYGVAWQDNRDGSEAIYFARIGPAGESLGGDVRLNTGSANAFSPSAVWTGTGFGVAWADSRHGDGEIYFARLDAAGNKIGVEVRVTNHGGNAINPSLVWNGHEYGIAYIGAGADIYFARVDASGNRIGADVWLGNAYTSSPPSLVWDDPRYLVAWAYMGELNKYRPRILLQGLDDLGNPLGYGLFASTWVASGSHIDNDPSVVWTGTEFALVWVDTRADDIFFARLDAGGGKIGADVRLTNQGAGGRTPSIVWTGSEFGVAFMGISHGNWEIYFVRLDASGAILAESRLTVDSANSSQPSLIWTGAEYGVVWSDDRTGNQEIYLARIGCCDDVDGDLHSECAGDGNDQDPGIHPGAPEACDAFDNDSDGATDESCDGGCDSPAEVGADIRITTGIGYSDLPALAWTGSGYGVAWEDDGATNRAIYFARLNASGGKLGADVGVSDGPADALDPAVVWIGAEFGVAWEDYRDGAPQIYFARLDAVGSKIGAEARVTTQLPNAYNPSLVWTGSEYGVAWNSFAYGNWEIYFARLDAAGNKLGADLRVTVNGATSSDPILVWTGAEYGLAWWDDRPGNPEIFFARIDPLGSKLGGDVQVTMDSAASYDPALVWTGAGFGVAWEDERDGGYEVYFARLDALGNKMGADVRVTVPPGGAFNPSLAWTGSEFGLSSNSFRDGDWEIYFNRLDASGTGLTETRLTNSAGVSSDAEVVWTGTRYSLAWWDDRNANHEIYFGRVGCACIGFDADADGYGITCDCDDLNAATHPGATEVNDGDDNQCAGEPGFGLVNEITAAGGFTDPADPNNFCWTPQQGATLYQVVRSDQANFPAGCVVSTTAAGCLADPGAPPSGAGYYYLVRALQPNPGSWGADAAGNERIGICGL